MPHRLGKVEGCFEEEKLLYYKGRRLDGTEVSLYAGSWPGADFLRHVRGDGSQAVWSHSIQRLHGSGLLMDIVEQLCRTLEGAWFVYRVETPVGLGLVGDCTAEAAARLRRETVIALHTGEAKRYLELNEAYSVLASMFARAS